MYINLHKNGMKMSKIKKKKITKNKEKKEIMIKVKE